MSDANAVRSDLRRALEAGPAGPYFPAERLRARCDPTGLAPDPATTTQAVIQVYAARAVSWRGIFAVHSWITVKPTGAPRYTRYEVLGFGVAQGAPAVQIDHAGPDNYWFGALPQLLLDRRGGDGDRLIERIRAAVAAYPYPRSYRVWPGPNSNTFTAYIGRAVPELGLALPAHAIGKDYLPGGAVVAAAPSGTGFQLSLRGALGLTVARREGIEVNLLGLNFGIDVEGSGLKLLGVGRIGWPLVKHRIRRSEAVSRAWDWRRLARFSSGRREVTETGSSKSPCLALFWASTS
jgi:hypothetical protein